jgi:acetyl esterase/lipase
MSIKAKIFAMMMRYQMVDFYKDSSVEVQRTKMERYAKVVKLPGDVTCEPANDCHVSAEWIDTPKIDRDRVILYLHGGAYFLPGVNSHRDIAARLGRGAQMRALLVDYRLAPENPYPAALQDVTAAYEWLLAEGYQPLDIAICGDSSGGGLALAALLRLRDMDIAFPAAAVCLCPWTDLTGSGASMTNNAKTDFINRPVYMKTSARYYAGYDELENPYISPLFADLTGFPPLLIQAATRDVLLDDATRLAG